MARHEGDLRRDAEVPLSLAELLLLIGRSAEGTDRARKDAIACYLSGGDGWKDAVKLLGGTFARSGAGLRDRKSD